VHEGGEVSLNARNAGGTVELAAKLALGQLMRPACFTGRVASVRTHGPHRLLLLSEICRDGRSLAVWVSRVALEAKESLPWAGLLDTARAGGSTVRFRGRFIHHDHPERLTADIHYPQDIWVHEATLGAAHAQRGREEA
jgi:hypothetical protein